MAVVELERRDHIALLTLNRPEARNAISPEVSQTMAALLDEIEADPALRAVVRDRPGRGVLGRRRPQGRRGRATRTTSRAARAASRAS